MRQIKANWTVIPATVIPANDIDTKVSDIMAKEIAEEIDWEVLSDMLVTQGWSRIRTKNYNKIADQTLIEEWCAINVKGKSRGRGGDWLFEKADDAAWFALRWS